ncbi:BnaA10g28710D [Brassica napus]|uniref:BnaA10g28710D protein n=1 Tax=Brassica napus TaxID=3708 RepID=A0A078J7D8_BRANA|nr:BnaA10g28710D [Brassica napus]
MVDDDKASNDFSLLPDLNDDFSTPFTSIEFDSSILDLINLEDGGETPNLLPEHNPFLESVNTFQEDEDLHFSVEAESPKVYIAPRAIINHHDSFSLDPRIDTIEDARISFPDSPRGSQDLSLSRLKVPGSPRALALPRASGSPRFGSPTSPAALIDTAAPFESVKDAVSKFGGITDWKAHKIQTIEKRKTVDQELEKIQEDMPEYKKQAFVAEEAKQQVVMELERTKSVVEELKMELEKAEKEEQQAKQDSDLAKLRVEEMEHGIADASSIAVKTQLEVAKVRNVSAVYELRVDSVLAAKEVEKQMTGLTIEVIATKKLLESARAAHLEAEENKLEAAMARDQDVYNREKELKMVEEEIERFRQEMHASDDVRIKIETASVLQQDLRAEITSYKDDNMMIEKRNNSDIQAAVDSTRKELEEVKSNIGKAISEVKTLKIIVGSLQSELEREKKDLSETKQREALSVHRNSKEAREERCSEIAKKLQEANKEAEEATSLASAAQEELRKAKEESEEARTGVSAIESQLVEAKREMEAAKASEKLALAAIKALQETEYSTKIEDISTPRSIIISVEEYYELSKQAHEVEEAANKKLAEIVSQIEVAKEEESRVLEKIEEVNRETAFQREKLKEAMDKVEKARDKKVSMDHELRKWSSENGKRSPMSSPEGGEKESHDLGKSKSALHSARSFAFGEEGSNNVGDSSNVTHETKKKKKRFSLLPKVFMFLSRKKSNK